MPAAADKVDSLSVRTSLILESDLTTKNPAIWKRPASSPALERGTSPLKLSPYQRPSRYMLQLLVRRCGIPVFRYDEDSSNRSRNLQSNHSLFYHAIVRKICNWLSGNYCQKEVYSSSPCAQNFDPSVRRERDWHSPRDGGRLR